MRFRAWIRPRPLKYVLAVTLLLVGWKGVDRYREAQRSPLRLWDFRPGMRFSALQKMAKRKTGRGFTCEPMLETARICEMPVSGIPGLLRAVVGADSTVARLQFLPNARSPWMREEGRRITAGWNRAAVGVADAPNERKESTTRWTSEDKKWSAVLRYGHLAKTPSLVQVTDRHAFGAIARSATLAPLVLALNELADAGDIGRQSEHFEALKLVRSGYAIDAGFGTALPAAARTVECQPEAGVPIPKAEIDAKKAYAGLLDVVRSAFAHAYGANLVFADDEIRSVDKAGRSERIRLGPLAKGESDVLAIAVHFPERSTPALERLLRKDTNNLCRSAGEVLFAQLAPNGVVKNVRRIPVGDDGYASDIQDLELVPHDFVADTAYIRARYTTAYGTDEWAGAVEWEGRITVDPPRLAVRAPLAFSGLTSKGRADEPVAILMTGRMTDSVELSTLAIRNGVHSSRSVIVPWRADSILTGNDILAALLERAKPTSAVK